MVQRILVADPKKCNGCKLCQIACSLKHRGVSNPVRSRIKVFADDAGMFLPLSCQHCEDAPCMKVCPKEAIFRDDRLERVMVDYDRCVSCRACAAACPYGAILYDPDHRKVYKCDLCDAAPECIRFCEPEALKFVNRSMLQDSRMRQAALNYIQAAKGRCLD